MFKRLPGDTSGLVTTTPETSVVFAPTVIRTPAIVTLVIWAFRLVAGVVRLVIRHPIAVAVTGGTAALWVRFDWQEAAMVTGVMLAEVGLLWVVAPRLWARWIGWRLVAWARMTFVYGPRWQSTMAIAGLTASIKGRVFVPRLVRVRCSGWADVLTVRMLRGQAPGAWAERTPNLLSGLGGVSCRVAVLKGARLRVTIVRRDELAVPLAALPVPEVATVGPVEIGRQENGEPYRLKVHGTHVLVAGATGAGKGSYIWSVIRGLLPAMAAGLVEVWALDPKRMELSFGRRLFGKRYAATPEECTELLERAVRVMQERADRYAGRRRSHVPTPDDPFVLVIVDEVAFLTAYQEDRGLRHRILAALATLTTQGRAVGVGVLAALQDPRKEVLTIRNLFPDKIALRLDEAEQVDMVLGDGARDRGALADEISQTQVEGAGVGYVRLEGSPDPVRVRAAYVSDDDIRNMERGYGVDGGTW
ncbi:FtsK/SpoIIIE domain-containing protein [Nonomuraea sp. NPDC048892]|uniref:FtsK/SpoIIIE domain-containing protein n=1 Tax=Nonomuraea sp. NPDC048892 TaxID=3154624 RepID=UPI0033C988AF